MLRKITRFTTLLCAAFLMCLLLTPTALAAGSNSSCNNNNYASYQGAKQIFGQNVASWQKNTSQAKEYKLTEASPIPKSNTSCKQTTGNSNNSSNCNSSGNSSTNCNSSVKCSSSNNCGSGTNCNSNSNCKSNNSCNSNSSCNSKNSSCTAVKPAQTTKPSQPNTTANQGNTANVSVSNYAAEVVRLVNVERANNNLPALTLDSQLTAAAQVRAEEATVKFSHTRPNGSSCFSVLSSMGISYRRAGENIAIGQSSPSQVVKAWMDSPGHRANILGDYTKIGVGVQQAGSNFSGYSWAQFFTK